MSATNMISISKNKNKKNEVDKKYDPLFDNPQIRQFRDSLSPEEKEKYDKIGKDLYDTINFETGETEDVVNDVLAQLRIMLNSGLHPSYLTYEEKTFLEKNLGKKWYEEFGYLENDVNRINI